MSQRIRVVFVLSSYTLGGAEKQLTELIAHRPASARDVDIQAITFLPADSPELTDRFAELGVVNTLVNRADMGFVAFFLQLVRTIWALRPTIVHTQLDSSPGAWGRLAAWLARVPVIVHSDLSLMEEGTRAHMFLRPLLDRVTDRFFPNAEAIGHRLAASGVPRERISVIPCGVDLPRFRPTARPEARARWSVPADGVVAGFLGRFAKVKRVDLLLDALTRLAPADRPDAVLLGGSGPEDASIRERIRSDPWLAEHCVLAGVVHDVPDFLSAVDYLVLSSDMEGLPNVVLEGMAMCRPIVGTSVSDVPRLIEGAGFLAEPGDAASMAEAITKMQRASAAEREHMGKAARRRIEREYDLERVANRYWEEHLELARLATERRRGRRT